MIGNFRENSVVLTELEKKVFLRWPTNKKPNSLSEFSYWLKNFLESDGLTEEEKKNIKRCEIDIWLRFCILMDIRD